VEEVLKNVCFSVDTMRENIFCVTQKKESHTVQFWLTKLG